MRLFNTIFLVVFVVFSYGCTDADSDFWRDADSLYREFRVIDAMLQNESSEVSLKSLKKLRADVAISYDLFMDIYNDKYCKGGNRWFREMILNNKALAGLPTSVYEYAIKDDAVSYCVMMSEVRLANESHQIDIEVMDSLLNDGDRVNYLVFSRHASNEQAQISILLRESNAILIRYRGATK